MRNGKRKFLRIITEFIILIFLLIFLSIILIQNNSRFFFNLIKGGFLSAAPPGLYSLSIGNFEVDFISGNLILKDLKLGINRDILDKSGAKKRKLVELSIGKAEFYNISWIDLIFKNRISTDASILKNGNLSYFFIRNPVSGKGGKKRKPLKIKSDLLKINNISFKYFTKSKSIPEVSIKKCSLNLKNLRVNSSSKISSKKNLYFSDPDLKLEDIFIFVKNRRYFLKIGYIDLTKIPDSAIVEDFTYSSYNPGNMNNSVQVKSKYIKIASPFFMTLDEGIGFKAQRIELIFPELNVFHKRKAKKRKKTHIFPHQFLDKISFPLRTGEIVIKNGIVRYSEHNRNEPREETIFISKIFGNFDGLNNIPRKDRPKYRKLNLIGLFMGKSNMKLALTIPGKNTKKNYYLYGRMSGTRLNIINDFISRNARIKFRSGYLEKLLLHLWINRDYAKGDLSVIYKNLKISVLKKKNIRRKRGLVSFLANTLIRNSNNIASPKFRKAKIYYPIPGNISFANYIWRAILSGIKFSVGL